MPSESAGRAWEALAGASIPPYQPVIGSRIFDVSSGVHVDGLLKDAESYEPFPPDMTGGERHIILDQHSGQSAVAMRLQALGILPGAVDLHRLTQRVREQGQTDGEVTQTSFLSLIRQTQEEACA